MTSRMAYLPPAYTVCSCVCTLACVNHTLIQHRDWRPADTSFWLCPGDWQPRYTPSSVLTAALDSVPLQFVNLVYNLASYDSEYDTPSPYTSVTDTVFSDC